MKKILIIALFSFLSINSLQAQDGYTEEEKKAIVERAQQQLTMYQNRTELKKGSKEYNDCCNKLKALDTKMHNSKSFQEESYLLKNFDKKLNQKIDNKLYSEQDVFFVWIEQNINSTEFRNTQAAKEDWLRLRTAQNKTRTDNKEYFDYFTELSLKYLNFIDLMVEVADAKENQK